MTTPLSSITGPWPAQPTTTSGTSGSGGSSGKRRIVRTAAGARRYGVPIGAEIGRARNDSAARFQRNRPAQQRYKALVGRDKGAQAAALKGLNRTQLTRLTALAWSFKSKNPAVTQLRTALTRELYNRGINVRTYLAEVGIRGKSLGRGSAFRHSKDKQGRPMPGTVEARAAAKPKSKSKPGGRARGSSGAAVPVRRARPPQFAPKKRRPKPKKVTSAMQARKNDRRLTMLSNVGQLRTAQAAFPKVALAHQERVARWLVGQAVELAAVHMLSRSVVEASKVTPDSELGQRVIELAGRWKHGYIPLDATALRSKMKGGNGKPWWTGGKTKRRGNKASLRKSIDAGRNRREGKSGGERTRTTTMETLDKPGGKVVSKQNIQVRTTPRKTESKNRAARVSTAVEHKGGPSVRGSAIVYAKSGNYRVEPKKGLPVGKPGSKTASGGRISSAQTKDMGFKPRTTVVKSGQNKTTRGAKVNQQVYDAAIKNGATPEEARRFASPAPRTGHPSRTIKPSTAQAEQDARLGGEPPTKRLQALLRKSGKNPEVPFTPQSKDQAWWLREHGFATEGADGKYTLTAKGRRWATTAGKA